MDLQGKIKLLEEAFDQDPGALTPETSLTVLHWDSMAKLTVIALIQEHFGTSLSGPQIKAFKTVGDIIDFME
jgi:acyl carrier protein